MSNLSEHRVALIGGAGFIGHNMALALKERGAEVEVIDGLEVNHLVHYAATPSSVPNRGSVHPDPARTAAIAGGGGHPAAPPGRA